MARKKIKKQVGGVVPRMGGNLAGANLAGARPMIKKGGKVKKK